jgi:hypothetical protein
VEGSPHQPADDDIGREFLNRRQLFRCERGNIGLHQPDLPRHIAQPFAGRRQAFRQAVDRQHFQTAGGKGRRAEAEATTDLEYAPAGNQPGHPVVVTAADIRLTLALPIGEKLADRGTAHFGRPIAVCLPCSSGMKRTTQSSSDFR